MKVAFFAANLALGIVLPVLIQLLDRRRMTAEERARVWSFATWGSAVYNFGPLSLVAWGYVTRSPRYVRGLAIGVGQAAIAFIAQGVIGEVIGRRMGLGERTLADAREGVVGAIAAAAALGVLVGAGRAAHEAIRRAVGARRAGP